jgi:hypothetical protein
MERLMEALDALEAACDNNTALITHHLPDLNAILAVIRELPPQMHGDLFSRLERIRIIMEGQLLLHAEEMERLRVQIRTTQRSSKAANAYGRVASIKVKPTANAN